MKTILAIIIAVIGINLTSHTVEAKSPGGGHHKHFHYTKTYIVKIKVGKGWKVVYRGKNWAYAKHRANQYRAQGFLVVFY